MRLVFRAFGYELDIALGALEDEPAEEYAGDVTTYPIGFSRPEVPWDHDCPVHQFIPDDSDEDA